MKFLRSALVIAAVTFFALLGWTYSAVGGFRPELMPAELEYSKLSLTDKFGKPMLVTYSNRFNFSERKTFSDFPEFLRRSFVILEDCRFYEHSGTDWKARFMAVLQNIRNFRIVRGASTITEQVIRIKNPRPRTLRSRWLEGFEAEKLETKFSKDLILEFYLNQVPYSKQRRGVVQAARTYFNRDIGTLNKLEMLTLAYMVRAPDRLDPLKNTAKLEAKVKAQAAQLRKKGLITEEEYGEIREATLQPAPGSFVGGMEHFVNFVNATSDRLSVPAKRSGKLRTSIDSSIQQKVRLLLEARITDLSERKVGDGAVLVLDHNKDQILAWVNAGDYFSNDSGSQIDAILAPRQPGSTLKPFLYALAMENGWSSGHLIEDQPLFQPVGNGIHSYKNYSRVHYGRVSLQQALGNSLNIPAIHTISFTGVNNFHNYLLRLGFESLNKPSDFYGEGLALGNGEVSLLELTQAYAVLARGGIKRPVFYLPDMFQREEERVISASTANNISQILSDPDARKLEFGRNGVFNFPMQVAVKTGTSTDFRDVWCVGYSSHYTVGIWLGNLNRESMLDVSGASGPGLLLRSIFNELYKQKEISRLTLKSSVDETIPTSLEELLLQSEQKQPRIAFPTPGLHVAMDPRVPDHYEGIRFKINSSSTARRTEWYVDHLLSAVSYESAGEYIWKLSRGAHTVSARVFLSAGESYQTPAVNFYVK